MNAVFGPKSLYSGLEICSLLPVVLNEANIIQDTRTTNATMSAQSAQFEPLGRGKYNEAIGAFSASFSFGFRIFRFHLGQVSTAIAVTKKRASLHRRGRQKRAKANPVKYVNQELTTTPTSTAAAQRCTNDVNS